MSRSDLTNGLRAQYHFRRTSAGLDAWDVRRLILLAEDLPVNEVDPNAIAELDQDHWFFHGSDEPTPRRLIDHMRLVNEAELTFPIILDASGRLMDGMHWICRALLEGRETIRARQFAEDPAPDYRDCDPVSLS